MKITVFGATGPTGQALVRQALSKGHEVTAYVRRTDVFTPGPDLSVVVGQLSDTEAMTKAIAGADAVVNLLGPAQKDPSNPVIFEATERIADIAIEQGVRRQVVVTAWGVAERRAETPWFFRAVLLKTILKKSFAIKEIQQKILRDPVRAAWLDLTLVQPGQLIKGDHATYKASDDGRTIKSKVSRPGLAAAILDVIEGNRWVGKSVVVGS
jgi:putative NADH-flavin reductase